MTELIVRDRLTTEQLSYIKDTDFIPKRYRGNVPAIMAAVVTGREYGLGDMESLRLIDVIEGKPELNAQAKLLLARKAGHSIVGEVTPTEAIVHGRRADNGDEMSVAYTLEDAKAAGLLSKDNWKCYPKEMLWARAITILCRRLFGDVVPAIPDAYEIESIAQSEEAETLEAATDVPPVDVAAVTVEDPGKEDAHHVPEPESSAVSLSLKELEAVVITKSDGEVHNGKTFKQLAAEPRGRHWLTWCSGQHDHPQAAAAAAYLKATEGGLA